jgi:hypothetical protein
LRGAPTTVQPKISLGVEDYGLKASITKTFPKWQAFPYPAVMPPLKRNILVPLKENISNLAKQDAIILG